MKEGKNWLTIFGELSIGDIFIDYKYLSYSPHLNYSNKLALSILLYHYDSYSTDNEEYCKYSYDFVLGITQGRLDFESQNTIFQELIDLKLISVKFSKNKILKFRPLFSNISPILRDCDKRVMAEYGFENYKIDSKVNSIGGLCKKIIYKTYIIEDEHTHLFKIGRSKDIANRYKTLQSTAPLLKLIMKSENDCEKILHEKFKDKRVRGEWFKLEEPDLILIVSEFNFKSCEDEESK